jgi:hypothetical protein
MNIIKLKKKKIKKFSNLKIIFKREQKENKMKTSLKYFKCIQHSR